MKKMYFYKFTNLDLFNYIIAEKDNTICNIFTYPLNENLDISSLFTVHCSLFTEEETPLIKKAAKQLEEYFNNERKYFDLPLNPKGTEFQIRVWQALQKIPYGETRSYGEIAAATGNPKACRAVGSANNKNPIHIIIPCHRVIGSDGSLTGYAGGLEIKKFLLEMERDNKQRS